MKDLTPFPSFPQELSVEAMAVVRCRDCDECYGKYIAKWGGNFGGGDLGLPGCVFMRISNWGTITEEVLVKYAFPAPSEGAAVFSFWNSFPEWTVLNILYYAAIVLAWFYKQ